MRDSFIRNNNLGEFLMKLRYLLLFIALLASLFACDSTEPEDIFIPGSITKYDGGEIKSGILSGDYTINGLSYARNTILSFYESGQVSNGRLSANATISSFPYQMNINFHRDISFYESGQVNTGTLSRWTTLGGVEYKWNIIFYSSGLIKQGRLSGGNATVSNLSFSEDIIYFYSNGIIKQGRLQYGADQNFRGTNYNRGHWIRFYPNGYVHSSSSSFDSNFNTNE